MNKVTNMNNIEYDNNNNIYSDMDIINQNYKNNEKKEIENNEEEDDEDEDDRLAYTLITLNLGNLIHIFEENNISFIDMLLLTKEDLKELQLSLFQRNRIYNFSLLFNKCAKNYSISEISDFFSFNKQFIFNSSIYDRVNMSSYEQNEIENNNHIYNEKNLDNNNDYYNNNYNNNFENKTININKTFNSKTDQQTYYNGGLFNNDNNFNNINKKTNNLNSNTNLNYLNKNNNSGNIMQRNSINKNQNQNNSINNLYYNNIDNSKKKQFKTINNNPNYKKETYKKYFNINKSSTMNNYLSIKKDTDDFLTKLNIQKEQSEIKKEQKYIN